MNRTTRAINVLSRVQGRTLLTTSGVAKRLNVAAWAVRKVFELGLLPPADRVGPYRVFDEKSLPAIREALVARGYLSADGQQPMKRRPGRQPAIASR